MQKQVEELRENLFSHNEQHFLSMLLCCFDRLDEQKKRLRGESLQHFTESMKNLSFAMQDKDYLLVTDILKFEIVPCFAESTEEYR